MDDNFHPHPGPVDEGVLYLQQDHRSNIAYDGDETVLRVRRCEYVGHDGEQLPQWMRELL